MTTPIGPKACEDCVNVHGDRAEEWLAKWPKGAEWREDLGANLCDGCADDRMAHRGLDVEMDDSMDGDHQSGLASAGFGTDEDYGVFGDEPEAFYDVSELAKKVGGPVVEWSIAQGVKQAGSKVIDALKAFIEAYATMNHGAAGISDEMRHAYDMALVALRGPDGEPELDRTAQMAVWGESMESGYQHCACRDCFETTIGSRGAMCDACVSSGCVPCDCEDPDIGCPHGECQSPTAYGVDGNTQPPEGPGSDNGF